MSIKLRQTRQSQIVTIDGGDTGATATDYLRFNNGALMSATNGFVMPSAGRIIAVSFTTITGLFLIGQSTTATLDIRDSGSSIYSASSSLRANATVQVSKRAGPEDITSFDKDAVITLHWTRPIAGSTSNTNAMAYIELDGWV
jgi:hypothetical protein